MNIVRRILRRLCNDCLYCQSGLHKGKNVSIRLCVYFDGPERVYIGDKSLINYGSSFHVGVGCGDTKIIIGNNVQIGMNCTFSCVSHVVGGENKRAGEHTYKSIIVEDGCWVGADCTILQGVTLAKGCVIAAGSVVTKSTLPNGLYAGVPAKRIKEL